MHMQKFQYKYFYTNQKVETIVMFTLNYWCLECSFKWGWKTELVKSEFSKSCLPAYECRDKTADST